ncbi:MAG: hypothetical protein CL840_19855 [Crocinitomicaceae bacterium]|nr:hypothetical protein [Crocinitomicaceae bacterium]|tara:strand:- start:5774 stop:6232 length:459 start_codon:yes stop_codon:yes gene_type:complete
MIISKKGTNQRTVSIEESFRAPKEKVFKAWTTPDSLKKWFMAEEGVVVQDAKVDLQVGGAYFIEVIYPGYDPTSIDGEFIHVLVPNELEYTWLTPVLNGKTTKVEVSFVDQEQGSKILLSHGEFENEEQMKLHIEGWTGCLGNLHEYLNSLI